jgi:signal transduction histidine kinase
MEARMSGARLRTKFLLSFLLVSAGLTTATLWMVHRSVRDQLQKEIANDLRNSVSVFQDFQRQREITLARSAELLASLPSLKALMTTRDSATIQDASGEIWRLAPSDIFLLADPQGKVQALQTSAPGITKNAAQELLKDSLGTEEPSFWWQSSGHLYEVFLRPIYFGAPKNASQLGVLCVGHEISETVAREVGKVASSQVAFFHGNRMIVSTLQPDQQSDLAQMNSGQTGDAGQPTAAIRLGGEEFLSTSVDLDPAAPQSVRLTVLKSYDKAVAFLDSLNRVLLGLGVLAVFAGTTLIFLISDTFTRPLANLVSGVRALEKGDFAYPLASRSRDELAEVTGAFERMRSTLRRSQQKLLDAERLATIGRVASSISHDLRHPLTAVMANAEFLCERDLDTAQREELYHEIRAAVDQMTELVESLLEFSKARESLTRLFGPVEPAVKRAIQTVRARPDFQSLQISVVREGKCETWFDQRKMERVFSNIVLNACEAAPPPSGNIQVNLREAKDDVEVRVIDNGPGVPESVRQRLFQPFTSYGKQNGIGLGLTISQKILQDHGGGICLESSESGRTVFRLTLPMRVAGDNAESR